MPEGLLVEQVLSEPDRIVILSRPKSLTFVCPLCGAASTQVHSRYQKSLADLPWQGRIIALRVKARRFRCVTRGCQRWVFAPISTNICLSALSGLAAAVTPGTLGSSRSASGHP